MELISVHLHLMCAMYYAPKSLGQHWVLLDVLLSQLRHPGRTIGSLSILAGPLPGPGRISTLCIILAPLDTLNALALSCAC